MSDQWDFYIAFIRDWSFWEKFNMQFGPQRQGIGLVITGLIDNLSGWNTRWTSFIIGVFILFSTVAYVHIKKKMTENLNCFDAFIPVIILSPVQFGIFTVTPFMSHSAIPALLISLFVLSLYIKPLLVRNLVLLVINFNMVFSSFGFFLGVILGILFLLEIFNFNSKNDTKKVVINSISLLITILTFYIFFIGYRSYYVQDFVEFTKPWRYILFIALGYAGVFGAKGSGLIQSLFGFFILSLVLWAFINSVQKVIFNNSELSSEELVNRKVILVLISYSLLFLVNSGFGRIDLGIHYAQTSRYYPYIVPSVVGVFYFFNLLKAYLKRLFVLLFFFLVIAYQSVSFFDIKLMRYWSGKKQHWKQVYLKYESVSKADSITEFKVHPDSNRVKERMKYLKKHKLNLFLDN